MSFRSFLTDLTENNTAVPAQLVLKNGMQIVMPRRLSRELDPEIPSMAVVNKDRDQENYPELFVGMVIAPTGGPGGQVSLVKAVFDPDDVSSLVFVPEENLPKLQNDKTPAPRNGGRTASGLIIP